MTLCKKQWNGAGHKGLIEDLDDIPFPDREVIKQERHLKYVEKQLGYRVASMIMGRGCPGRCTFCASKSVWSTKNRLRSPENILQEMELITDKYNLDFISFADDEIGLNKKHLLEFCKLKAESNCHIQWGCNMIASAVDHEVCNALRNANCKEIWIGVESGSPEILKDMKKPVNLDQIMDAFEISAEYGLKRRAYCLLGMPNESYETIRQTESLIDIIDPDVVGFTILAPYPGSDFYDKKIHANVDWSNVDEYSNDIISSLYLTNEQLKKR
jgi:radical SAM superfamily enzyme YgiQ (UPF0313 family)